MSRAVRFTSTGGPEVLRVVEVDEPIAGEGRVRVAVRAAGLNPYDSKVRRGDIAASLPAGQGAEFAGVVDQTGPDVSGWAIGDEVIGWTVAAAHADFIVVPQKNLAHKPGGLDWATAGSFLTVSNTAWRSIDTLGLGGEDTLLVSGAAGGVGMLAAQFAAAAGARVVGTARESAHDFLRGLGVTPVTPGDGIRDRLAAVAPDGYTAALDTVGRESVELALALGVPVGRINSIVDFAAGSELGISNVGGGARSAEQFERFAHDLAEGRLVLPIRATFPLAEVRRAYELLETGHGTGKIALTTP